MTAPPCRLIEYRIAQGGVEDHESAGRGRGPAAHTGTSSLRQALEQLLGGPCCHMSALPGHPFDLGEG